MIRRSARPLAAKTKALIRQACLAGALLGAAILPVLAVQPDEILADPVLEARARVLSKELRCMVCQNQSIDDSEAPLAKDLRVLVRERLKSGDSDQQVLDFLVARYGEFVLLNPRFNWHTALLWLGPPTVLLGGALALLLFAWRRRAAKAESTASETSGLTPEEESRLEHLLKNSQG
jgi:cytochrome c-type biogenesis protein CcmH